MKTSTIASTLLSTFLSVFAASALGAENVTVACYPSTSSAQLYLQFYNATQPIGLTYSYKGALGEDSCIAEPNSSFSKNASYVTISGNIDSAVHLVAQIITGDIITPVFECNAEVQLAMNQDGQMILQSGVVNHLNVTNNLAEFIGQPCYVQ